MKGDLERFRKDVLGWYKHLSGGEKMQLINYIQEKGGALETLDERGSFNLELELRRAISSKWGDPLGRSEKDRQSLAATLVRYHMKKRPDVIIEALAAIFLGRRKRDGD